MAYATTQNTGRTALVKTLTILSGQTVSSDVLTADELQFFSGLEIHGDPTAHTGTVTVQKQREVNSDTWSTLQSPPGTDVTVAATKVTAITQNASPALRLLSSAAEGGDRVFKIHGVRQTVQAS